MKPGKHFAEILQAVQTRQLEGSLTSREEALEWIKSTLSGGNGTT
jgi:hypothetical protein